MGDLAKFIGGLILLAILWTALGKINDIEEKGLRGAWVELWEGGGV